jgi:hypothetical protein
MKGVIAIALKEMVVNNFGDDKWREILNGAGIEKEPVILPFTDVDDGIVMNILQSTCRALNLTVSQAGDAFGNYWVNTYASKHYSGYFTSSKSAREFLLNMDKVHTAMTNNMKGAKPPRFMYDWENDKTLNMKYISERGLIDILIGLVKGVATYYKENLDVEKTANDRVRVVFQ